jgi:hypothetical protein
MPRCVTGMIGPGDSELRAISFCYFSSSGIARAASIAAVDRPALRLRAGRRPWYRGRKHKHCKAQIFVARIDFRIAHDRQPSYAVIAASSVSLQGDLDEAHCCGARALQVIRASRPNSCR